MFLDAQGHGNDYGGRATLKLMLAILNRADYTFERLRASVATVAADGKDPREVTKRLLHSIRPPLFFMVNYIFFPVHFAPCKECGGGLAAKHKSGRTAEGLCEHIGRESCARWDELHVLHHCGMKSLMATKWVVDLVLISVKLKNIFSTFAEGCMVHVD